MRVLGRGVFFFFFFEGEVGGRDGCFCLDGCLPGWLGVWGYRGGRAVFLSDRWFFSLRICVVRALKERTAVSKVGKYGEKRGLIDRRYCNGWLRGE